MFDFSPAQLRAVYDCDADSRAATLAQALRENDPSRVAALLATGCEPNGCVKSEGNMCQMLTIASMVSQPNVSIGLLLLTAHADPADAFGWCISDLVPADDCENSFSIYLRSTLKGFKYDSLLAEYREAADAREPSPINPFADGAKTFLRNLQEADLLHAAALMCDVESICLLLVLHGGGLDPNREIEIGGCHACPLSLAYYSRGGHQSLCIKALLSAHADPRMPSSGSLPCGPFSAGWTLATAARHDKHRALTKLVRQVPICDSAIARLEPAAEWFWRRILRMEQITTTLVKSSLDYLRRCMFLQDLVRAVLEGGDGEGVEKTHPDVYSRVLSALSCLAAQYNDSAVVSWLLAKQSAASTGLREQAAQAAVVELRSAYEHARAHKDAAAEARDPAGRDELCLAALKRSIGAVARSTLASASTEAAQLLRDATALQERRHPS